MTLRLLCIGTSTVTTATVTNPSPLGRTMPTPCAPHWASTTALKLLPLSKGMMREPRLSPMRCTMALSGLVVMAPSLASMRRSQ